MSPFAQGHPGHLTFPIKVLRRPRSMVGWGQSGHKPSSPCGSGLVSEHVMGRGQLQLQDRRWGHLPEKRRVSSWAPHLSRAGGPSHSSCPSARTSPCASLPRLPACPPARLPGAAAIAAAAACCQDRGRRERAREFLLFFFLSLLNRARMSLQQPCCGAK